MEISKPHLNAKVTPMPMQAKSNNLEVLWTPLLNLLKLVGLFHYKEKSKWWENVWKMYSCLVLLFIFGMTTLFIWKSYPSFTGNNIPLATQVHSIADIFWYAVILGNAVGLFLASHQPSKWKTFFQKWLQLTRLLKNEQLQKKVKKQAWNNAAISTILIFLCCIEITILLTDEGRSYLFIIANYFLQSIEMLSIAFFALIATTLTTLSSFANMQFIKAIAISDKEVYMNWEKCRSTYVTVIELIDIADHCLCFPVGWCIFVYVIQFTLFSYTYVLYYKGSDKPLYSINSAIWNIFLLISLFIVLWNVSSVNTEIHSVYPHLCKLKLGCYPLSMQNEMMFLQNRLGNQSIGITVFRVHLITRHFAASIVSAYLTYLIILLQFRN